jgi:hypothetical protein
LIGRDYVVKALEKTKLAPEILSGDEAAIKVRI